MQSISLIFCPFLIFFFLFWPLPVQSVSPLFVCFIATLALFSCPFRSFQLFFCSVHSDPIPWGLRLSSDWLVWPDDVFMSLVFAVVSQSSFGRE